MKIDEVLIGNIIVSTEDDNYEIIHSLFTEDEENYYDILDNNREYDKDAELGYEPLVIITNKLVNFLPNVDKEYNLEINDILLLLPKYLYDNLTYNPLRENVKTKRKLHYISMLNDD